MGYPVRRPDGRRGQPVEHRRDANRAPLYAVLRSTSSRKTAPTTEHGMQMPPAVAWRVSGHASDDCSACAKKRYALLKIFAPGVSAEDLFGSVWKGRPRSYLEPLLPPSQLSKRQTLAPSTRAFTVPGLGTA